MHLTLPPRPPLIAPWDKTAPCASRVGAVAGGAGVARASVRRANAFVGCGGVAPSIHRSAAFVVATYFVDVGHGILLKDSN